MASNSIFDSFATYSSAFLRGEYSPGSFVPRWQETASGFVFILFINLFIYLIFFSARKQSGSGFRCGFAGTSLLAAARRGFSAMLRAAAGVWVWVWWAVCCRLFWPYISVAALGEGRGLSGAGVGGVRLSAPLAGRWAGAARGAAGGGEQKSAEMEIASKEKPVCKGRRAGGD